MQPLRPLPEHRTSRVRTCLGNARGLCARRFGLAATEAVITLPLLLGVVVAGADLGRAIHAQIALTNSVRVGAEYGAMNRFTTESRDAWEAALQTTVLEEAATIPGFDSSRLTVTVTTATEAIGTQRIQVSAQYFHRPIVNWSGRSGDIVMRDSACMRQYR